MKRGSGQDSRRYRRVFSTVCFGFFLANAKLTLHAQSPTVSTTISPSPQASPLSNTFPTLPVHDVVVTALRFLAPRTLDAHTAREFSLWGLDGITAIDPAVSVEDMTASPPPDESDASSPQTDTQPPPTGAAHTIRIVRGEVVLFSRPAPADNASDEWADLVTNALRASWAGSNALQSNGVNALLQSFFDELFNHLDPYSRYLAPVSASSDRAKRVGDMGSIGITLANVGHTINVVAVNANGPAWEAGVEIGQRVLSVDGEPVHNETAEQVQRWLDGKNGTLVTLKLTSTRRQGTLYRLRRTPVPPETVFLSKTGPYTILKITSFSSETAEEISQYLSSNAFLEGSRPAAKNHSLGLILDLRGDRGGVVQQAVTTAALFLNHGIAVTTHGRHPLANHVWAVQGGDMTNGVPIAVLVDGRTASAAEILAAALADHHRGVVIGSETFGKGLTQVIGQMPNGGELFVTWSRNNAPLGWPIQGLGVMPQICTSLGAESLQAQIQSLARGQNLLGDSLQAARTARAPLSVSYILHIREHCPAALGSDNDMTIATTVLASQKMYGAALKAIPDESTVPLH